MCFPFASHISVRGPFQKGTHTSEHHEMISEEKDGVTTQFLLLSEFICGDKTWQGFQELQKNA